MTWFVDEAIFQCDVVLAKREVAETTIEVRYQVCNDTMCLPPSTLAVTLPLARAATAAGR